MPPVALHNRHPDLLQNFVEQGFFLLPGALPVNRVAALKAALHKAIAAEAPLRRPSDDPSLVVCCPWYDDLFLEVLRADVFPGINRLLDSDSILYSYNNSCIRPGTGNFSSHIHVEREYTTGEWLEAVGVMILLDEFTEENGASWFLPSSWREETSPPEQHFRENSERLLAPAGSIFFFHPHLWHSGGLNRSDDVREALTIGFCRPYLKQRLDFPAMFDSRRHHFPHDVVQKLGFFAQPPRSIQSFYGRGGGWQSSNLAPTNVNPATS